MSSPRGSVDPYERYPRYRLPHVHGPACAAGDLCATIGVHPGELAARTACDRKSDRGTP